MSVKEPRTVMCEANAYLIDSEEEKLVMEAVDTVVPEEGGLRLVSIFGDQKFLKAKIHSLSLVDHKVFLKTTEE
jgi:predicted RNA-binding protein